MDFSLPPEVLEDIRQTVSHGIFGYTEPTQPYYEAVCGWFQSRFGFSVTREAIVPSPGVVFSLTQIVRAFTREGDGVIIQTPVYYPFYHMIRDNNRQVVANPLVYNGGRYAMDFEGFERLAAQRSVKLFLLCSPHNPVGRVWTREELKRIRDICKRHGILVVSDEIHCDFVWQGHEHTCYGLLDEDAIVCAAPSKTFNLAGLQVSHIFVRNAEMRKELRSEFRKTGYGQLNAVGCPAAKASIKRAHLGLMHSRNTCRRVFDIPRSFCGTSCRKSNWSSLREPISCGWIFRPMSCLRPSLTAALRKVRACGWTAVPCSVSKAMASKGSTLPVQDLS